MKWLKKSEWRLGIGVLLAGAGGVWMYRSAIAGSISGTWAGLAVFFAAMAIPLIIRFFTADGEGDPDKGG